MFLLYGTTEKLTGGEVLVPVVGFHNKPLATLDFYPSIIYAIFIRLFFEKCIWIESLDRKLEGDFDLS